MFSFRLREHEALPDPTYKSITVDDLVKKLGGTSAGESGGSDGLSFSEGEQHQEQQQYQFGGVDMRMSGVDRDRGGGGGGYLAANVNLLKLFLRVL